ncbi:hypothetical protein Hanom_Chr02g00105441 [Helianthus anomalus]
MILHATFNTLWAFGIALRVLFVPVTRAFIFMSIRSRRHTLTLFATYSTIL